MKNKRARNKRNVRRARNPASLANPPRSIGMLQKITMWMGFLIDTSISGPTGGFAYVINPSLISNFTVRASTWLNYRMVAWDAQVTIVYPGDNTAAGFPAAVAAVEYSGTSGSSISPPNNMGEISVLPQTKYLSTSGLNSRNTTRLKWRARDINSLLFQPVSNHSIAARQSYIVGRIERGSVGGNTLFIRGRMKIEFRDMVAFSSMFTASDQSHHADFQLI